MKNRRFKPLKRTWRDFLQQMLPCHLCQSSYAQYSGLCKDCWINLPWALTDIQREGLTIKIIGDYTYPLDKMILSYKKNLLYKDVLIQLLLQAKLPNVQAVMAMPISSQRLIERGFNQSLVLAKGVAKHLKRPIWQPVYRIDSYHQKGLSRTERLANIHEQFQLVPQIHQQKRYQSLLIIDDVVTTGASLLALTQALEPLNINQIYYLCVAGAGVG